LVVNFNASLPQLALAALLRSSSMKTKLKIYSLLIVMAVSLALISACGSDDGPPDTGGGIIIPDNNTWSDTGKDADHDTSEDKDSGRDTTSSDLRDATDTDDNANFDGTLSDVTDISGDDDTSNSIDADNGNFDSSTEPDGATQLCNDD